MEFNKRTALIGFCCLVTVTCAVVFSADKSNGKREMVAELVNGDKPVAAEIPIEMSASSKPIDLATFSWSEQEQTAAFNEASYAYQNTIKNISIDDWDSNYYEGLKVSRPPDISFPRGQVPIIEQLRESPYKALYIDNDIYVRVKSDNTIEESTNNGESWQVHLPTPVAIEDYIYWLEEHDPIPSGIVRRAQLLQLKNGASVYKGTFDNQKEMFFILDTDLAQIQLLSQDVYFEQERWSFVLIDAEQFLLGLNRIGSIVPIPLLQEFYDELVSCEILTEIQAQQEMDEKILHLTLSGFMSPDEKEQVMH